MESLSSLTVTVTEPAVPTTDRVSTRPPHSPKPLRVSTVSLVKAPIAGYFEAMVAPEMVTVQLWYGFFAVPSPSSGSAGNGVSALLLVAE